MDRLLVTEGPLAFAAFHVLVANAVYEVEGRWSPAYGVTLTRGQVIAGRKWLAERISEGLPKKDREKPERFESLIRRALARWSRLAWIKCEPLSGGHRAS